MLARMRERGRTWRGGVKLYDLELIREARKTKRPCRVSMQYASLGRFGVSRVSHEFKVETVAAGGGAFNSALPFLMKYAALLILKQENSKKKSSFCHPFQPCHTPYSGGEKAGKNSLT
jgi:hypothetical protein